MVVVVCVKSQDVGLIMEALFGTDTERSSNGSVYVWETLLWCKLAIDRLDSCSPLYILGNVRVDNSI